MRFLKVLPKPKTLLELSFEDWQRLLSTKDYELPRHLAVKLRDKSKTIVVNEHKNFKTLRDYVSH